MGQRVKWGFAFGIMFAIFFLSLQMVQAEEFPNKPVSLYMPQSPGGSHDLTARALSSAAMEYLGQPIVIKFKPGASGAIVTDYVASSKADGYTLLFGAPVVNSTMPAVENKSKGPNEMTAVCRINYSPTIIAARTDLPYKTFKEMLAWAKANPGQLAYGHTGVWNFGDIAGKQIVQKTGINIISIPHVGGGPALLSILGGHTDVTAALSAVLLPHIQAGKLRALAVLDTKRLPSLPDVPTARELGVDVVTLVWRGVIAPKGTPRPVVDKLAEDFKKIVADPSVVAMIRQMGDDVQYLGPDEFRKFWVNEYEEHKELAKLFKK